MGADVLRYLRNVDRYNEYSVSAFIAGSGKSSSSSSSGNLLPRSRFHYTRDSLKSCYHVSGAPS